MDDRKTRVLTALEGLSVGDALGDQFARRSAALARCLLTRTAPPAPWRHTDDTRMACSLVNELLDHGEVDSVRLAARFARRFDAARGYGPAMRRILTDGADGATVVAAAARLFGGRG